MKSSGNGMRMGVVSLSVALAACSGSAQRPPVTTDPERPMIVQAGDPVLRQRAEEVPLERIATPEFQALLDRMIETMRRAPGVGLAAPQIGVGWRVFVLEDSEERMSRLSPLEVRERERVAFAPRVFINPSLRAIGEERASFFEGCLSVDGFAAVVTRAREVEISGLDRDGNEVSWRASGWPARILQHEFDHLDGTLYIDRMHSRSFMGHAAVAQRFAGKPIAEVLSVLGVP